MRDRSRARLHGPRRLRFVREGGEAGARVGRLFSAWPHGCYSANRLGVGHASGTGVRHRGDVGDRRRIGPGRRRHPGRSRPETQPTPRAGEQGGHEPLRHRVHAALGDRTQAVALRDELLRHRRSGRDTPHAPRTGSPGAAGLQAVQTPAPLEDHASEGAESLREGAMDRQGRGAHLPVHHGASALPRGGGHPPLRT